jgi:branched-chain amino acid transport system substrate-binding protein
MRKRKLLIQVSSICLILSLVSVCFIAACKSPAPEPKTLRIGAIFALSGWLSPFDTISNGVAEVTRDIINEQGGVVVNGEHYNIELVVEDSKSTMDGVTAAANKLVYDEGVKFIVGPSFFFSVATAPICEPNKVISALMFNTLSPGELDANSQYAFLCNNATIEHAICAMDYLQQAYPQVKTVCVATPQSSMQFVDPVVRKMLTDRGYTIIGDTIPFADDLVDFTPIASKCIASGADAIYDQNALVTHMGPLLKSLREQGSNMLLASTLNVDASEVLAICGEAAATNFFTQGLMPYPPDTPPLMKEIMDRYYAQYGSEAGIHMQTPNCLFILKQVIEKAQSFDTTVIKDTWETMDTFDTAYGTGHLGGLETYGIKHAISHPDMTQVLDNGEVKFGAWEDVRVP